MADKQATVYIVDQGQSMGECHNGRVESDLDFGMRYIWDAIATTMSAGKASWSIGVVGVRTDETNNPLEEDEGYQHISIMKHLGPMEMSHLRELQSRIRPSHSEDGDAISAIVVGVERVAEFTTLKTGKMGKYARKLVLVTNGLGTMDGEDIESIAERINECEIELVVMYVLSNWTLLSLMFLPRGIDFDDEEFGFVEEDKPALKVRDQS
jgi:ATP-dependent DNA helicase 2 subunit 2